MIDVLRDLKVLPISLKLLEAEVNLALELPGILVFKILVDNWEYLPFHQIDQNIGCLLEYFVAHATVSIWLGTTKYNNTISEN